MKEQLRKVGEELLHLIAPPLTVATLLTKMQLRITGEEDMRFKTDPWVAYAPEIVNPSIRFSPSVLNPVNAKCGVVSLPPQFIIVLRGPFSDNKTID